MKTNGQYKKFLSYFINKKCFNGQHAHDVTNINSVVAIYSNYIQLYTKHKFKLTVK